MIQIPRVLSIAGTDPTGGAGIQADLKSIEAAGGYGMCVVTALVAQNTQGVRSVHTPPEQFLREQLDAVSDDVVIDAIKIGMLGNTATTAIVRDWLEELQQSSEKSIPVVLDPVMVSTSGHRLLEPDAERAVRDFSKLATAVTPNLPELAVLCNQQERDTLEAAISDAQLWAASAHTAVIVKGGHLRGEIADNAVVWPSGDVFRVPNPRVTTKNTHGTGCSLSSAVAARLGAGDDLNKALDWSTRWLREALVGADALAVGQGNGPVDHGVRSRRLAAEAGLL